MPQAKDGGRDVLRSHAFVSFAAGKRRKCRGFRAARAFFDRGANSTNRGANSANRGANSTNRGANSTNRGANSTNRGANSAIWAYVSAPSSEGAFLTPQSRCFAPRQLPLSVAFGDISPRRGESAPIRVAKSVFGSLLASPNRGGGKTGGLDGGVSPLFPFFSRWTPRSTWSFPRRRR